MENQIIKIYTDGSCSRQLKIGGWAAIILVNDDKKLLHGYEFDTTHNRMELLAVIKSLEYVLKNFSRNQIIQVYTDSQYVFRIPERTKKLLANNFITKKGKLLQNTDLIKKLIELLQLGDIRFIKVKAHQKTTVTPNYNRDVDKLSRQIVRDKTNKHS